MYDFHQLASVDFDSVVVFSRPKIDALSDIERDTPAWGANPGEDMRAWSKLANLGLSDQARHVEKCLITLVQDNDATDPATISLRSRRAKKLIVLIRPAARGWLYLDGFRVAARPSSSHGCSDRFDPARKTIDRNGCHP